MKFFTSTIDPSVSSYGASISTGPTSKIKTHYSGRQAFCPGAGWMAWGYVAMVRDLNVADMPQA